MFGKIAMFWFILGFVLVFAIVIWVFGLVAFGVVLAEVSCRLLVVTLFSIVRLLPMKNSVTTSRRRLTSASTVPKVVRLGIQVTIAEVSMKLKMNQGIAILLGTFVFSWSRRYVKLMRIVSGVIYKARTNFTIIPTYSNSRPYLS